MGSKKRPLWLCWTNPDPLAQISFKDLKIIFKNGDGKCSLVCILRGSVSRMMVAKQ